MNRLILIGNGFDLAHGLKTSYGHFIDWYWKEWGYRLLHGQSKKEEYRLCSFGLKDSVGLNMWFYVWHVADGFWHLQLKMEAKKGTTPSKAWLKENVVRACQGNRSHRSHAFRKPSQG